MYIYLIIYVYVTIDAQRLANVIFSHIMFTGFGEC